MNYYIEVSILNTKEEFKEAEVSKMIFASKSDALLFAFRTAELTKKIVSLSEENKKYPSFIEYRKGLQYYNEEDILRIGIDFLDSVSDYFDIDKPIKKLNDVYEDSQSNPHETHGY